MQIHTRAANFDRTLFSSSRGIRLNCLHAWMKHASRQTGYYPRGFPRILDVYSKLHRSWAGFRFLSKTFCCDVSYVSITLVLGATQINWLTIYIFWRKLLKHPSWNLLPSRLTKVCNQISTPPAPTVRWFNRFDMCQRVGSIAMQHVIKQTKYINFNHN